MLLIPLSQLQCNQSQYLFSILCPNQNREILDAQKRKLEEELDYFKGFLASVEKKLGNERFVQNAKPEVVDIEKKKKADAEAKIKAIEESLAAL